MVKEIKGRHVLIGAVLAFGVIIGANMTLAVNAVRTFPGLEVKNSYVASQNFDRERSAQLSLGWNVSATVADGELRLAIKDANGKPVRPAELEATFGRATHVRDDQTPDFRYENGVYVAPVDAAGGNWNIRLKAVSENGTEFQQRIVLRVRS